MIMEHLAAQWNLCFGPPTILFWAGALARTNAADRLTDSGQFDILVFGPIPGGGSDAIRSTTSTRFHLSARRRSGVAARGARAAGRTGAARWSTPWLGR